MSLAKVAHVVRSFLEAERNSWNRVEVPWWRRLWLYRHGILSSRDVAWDLSRHTVDDYLTDRQRSACHGLSRPHEAGLRNKVLYHGLVGRTHDHLLPDVYGVLRAGEVVGGGVIGGDGAGGIGAGDSLDDVLSLVDDESIVAKPVEGSKGESVRVLDRTDGQFRVDGRPVPRREVKSLLSTDRDLVLEERVSHAEYAATVYPDATNTVRLITMLDRRGEPFVAAAMHRFGRAASGGIDNWDAGGVSAGIDVRTGVLGQVAVQSTDGSGIEWTTTHPETGVRVTGTRVPAWDRVVDAVLDLADEYGWLWPYVGWDVVVTDDAGTVTVLEGNRNPGVEGIQTHEPLLSDDRVREFFERHNVV